MGVEVGTGLIARAAAGRSIPITVGFAIYNRLGKPAGFVVGVGTGCCVAAEYIGIAADHAALGSGDGFVKRCRVTKAENGSGITLQDLEDGSLVFILYVLIAYCAIFLPF